MIYIIAAYLVFFLHLLFILFVPLGGLLLFRRWWWGWIHGPVFIWGVLISFAGWVCPLTPLENLLREKGGALGYSGGFIDHYLVPIIYPVTLTRTHQYLLGLLVFLLNFIIYFKRGRTYASHYQGKRKVKTPPSERP